MKTQTRKTRTLLAGAAFIALVACPLARADYQSTVISQGPVGYWRLSETTPSPAPITTAVNLGSSAAGNGTYDGSSGYFRGQPGALADSSTSVHIDGTAQSVTVPYNADMNPASNFTIECWLKADSAGAQCPISCAHAASPRSGWFFYQVSATGYEFRMYNTNGNAFSVDVIGNAGNVVGVWTHVVATFDGTTAKLYLNGVLAGSANPTGSPNYVPGTDGQFAVGMRSDAGFRWAGGADEVAFYPSVLSDVEIATHYGAASTNTANYVSFVTGKSPLLYLRLNEAGNTPTANLGTLGAAGNGEYTSGTLPGQVGPRPAAYPGFDALNYSTLFSSSGGSVAVPALNLNANTVTISGWVKPDGSQALGAGLVVCNGGGTWAGLVIDPAYGGLGLGYQWGSTANNVSFSTDLGLPALVDSQWSYVALVIQPSQAAIYVCDYLGNWSSATNGLNLPINNASLPFSAATLFGMDGGYTARNFNGNLDEVAIFNRALGVGELFTQYAEAVGGLKPVIFADLQPPPLPVAVGDPLVLSVDAGGTPPLSFKWHNTNGGPDMITTSNTLVIASAVLSDASDYNVTITNASGSATSQVVHVYTVTPTPPVASKWEGFNNRTLYKGGTLKLAVAATGGGLKYKWYKNTVLISGATASAYTIPVVTNSDAGSYSVYITNSAGTLSNGPVVITIPNMASNSYEGVVITAGPEAWWRLDEASGTNMFDGMGRHDGNYTNAAGGATLPTLGAAGALVGDTNTAATFSSAGQGIGLAPFSPAFSPTKSTIEAWVKTSVTDGQVPVSSSFGSTGWWMQSIGGWWFGVHSGGYWGNNNPDGTNINELAAIIPGAWSHVVLIYDTANPANPFRLYVNAKTDGYIYGGVPVNSGGPFIIGGRGVSAATLVDRLFDGSVDEVAFYSRVLSAAEITSHYTARGTVVLAPSFITPLLSQTVTTGKSISFSTTVQGTAPISLQWYKNGAPINLATNATYAIASTAMADTGTYTLWATNAVGTNSLSASLTVIPPAGYANVTNNLVLHLRFDGNTTDSSGRGNNGTASSTTAPAFVTGIIGAQALQYTTTCVTNQPGTNIVVGSASYVALGTVGSGPPADLQFGAGTSFSVSLWVKLPATALPGDLPFIGTATNSANNPGWVLSPSYHGGGWQWDISDGSGTNLGNNIDVNGPANSINDGAWHNFVLTVDRTGAVADSYLDGVHTASKSLSGFGSVDNNNYWPLVIGQDPTGTYPFIAGTNAGANDFAAWFPAITSIIDDVGVWRRALMPLEVAQLNSAGVTSGRSFDTVGPTLAISYSGGNVVLTYSGGTLVESSDPTVTKDAWTPVAGASSPWPVTPSAAKKYYSVRQ